MDTNRGFCWRCNEGPMSRENIKTCTKCKFAEYCSRKCQRDDVVRHESVECPTWAVKKCGACGKNDARMVCSGCYSIWYCTKECQRPHWPKHKPRCRQMQDIVRQVAARKPFLMCDYPFYFSNSFANDLLQLQSNELSCTDQEGFFTRQSDFCILLPASGDLRHMMKTTQSLPRSYQGLLRFVINDIDPFVMARNVLLLYMMSHYEKSEASSISTIWLSLVLSGQDFALLYETLSKLISADPEKLKTSSNGLIVVNASAWNSLREVWVGWQHVTCWIGERGCINLVEEKKAIFDADPGANDGLREHLLTVPERHTRSISQWFEDGVICSGGGKKLKLTHYNPTFTGRCKELSLNIKSPSTYKFRYCVRSDCIPYQMWDYLEMSRFKMVDSITEMCHAFTTQAITMVMEKMYNRRLFVHVYVEDYVVLHKVMKPLQVFDRIFSTNLIDYHGITDVLKVLEPLLSKDNPHAVIMTETFNWAVGIADADAVLHSDMSLKMEITRRHQMDAKVCIPRSIHEYYDNMPYFMNYLRGDRLAGMGALGQSQDKLPNLKDAMDRQGLAMRNICKGRNHVVPFNRRVHARAVNMLRGLVRTLEWYRPTGR